jgi:hypothetical protein
MDSTETTSIGTVPASVSSNETSTSGINVGALLQQIQGDTATQQKLMREAITPVSGSHVGQIPSALTKPIGPAPQTEGYAQPRSKGQAISNMITSAGNAVSKVITAEKEQKQTHLTDAATKLFTAQAAIDEAQQQHDSATAIGDNATAQKAQQLIDQNTKVRDGITSDPKLRKALAKGLNIDYIDPSNNKTEEHAAVQAAIKNAKTIQEKKQLAKQAQQQHQQQANQQGAQNFGAAFAKSQPQTLAPNQMAQAQLEAYQQQRKDAIETFKAMGPIYAEQLRAKGAITVEGMRSATDLRKAAIDSAAKLDEQILKNKQADKDNAAARSLEGLRNANARSLELLRQGNPIEVLKSFNDAQKNYETAITENQKSRQALNNELDKASSSRAPEIRRQLQAIDASDEQTKNAFTLNRNVIAKGLNVSVDDPRLQIPTVHVGEGAQNGAGAAGTSAKSVSTDNDPRTGKAWKSSVSAADRLIVKAYYGAGIVSYDASQEIDSINQGVRKVQRFFDPDKNSSD